MQVRRLGMIEHRCTRHYPDLHRGCAASGWRNPWVLSVLSRSMGRFLPDAPVGREHETHRTDTSGTGRAGIPGKSGSKGTGPYRG